jgi:hypothetical protein
MNASLLLAITIAFCYFQCFGSMKISAGCTSLRAELKASPVAWTDVLYESLGISKCNF